MAEPQHVIDARAQVARLYRFGRTPSQSEADAARAEYVTVKIDAEIRKTVQKSLHGAHLDDTQAAHLCGLVLSHAGVKGKSVDQIEQIIRAAVLEAQQQGGGN